VTGHADREALQQGAASFGRWLSQERELRGLGRDEVVRLSRLTPAIVEALESGDPDRMPPKAYVFGYLRNYAGAVGLDGDDVVLRWQEVVGPEDRPGAARASRPPVPWRAVLALAVAVALAVLAAVALLGPREREPLRLDPRRPATDRARPYEDGRRP